MNMTNGNGGISVGERAPSFRLDAISRDGAIALEDYLGRAPLFLNLMRGLHCPFCRRNMARLQEANKEIQAMGVETLVVISTKPDRARTYLRYRPMALELASDPATQTHRSYGLARVQVTEDSDDWPRAISGAAASTPISDPTGEISGLMSTHEIAEALNAKDGITPTEDELMADFAEGLLTEGHYMIDRDGIVRWVNLEADSGPTGFGKMMAPGDIVAAARNIA